MTERKLQANRRNALRSTGPKSPDGKSRSRWNALNHGLLAKAVIIEEGESKERREDLETLIRALQADLAPEGALEQILVEKIAVAYWRLSRLLTSETARIRSQVEAIEAEERRREREEWLDDPSSYSKWPRHPESLLRDLEGFSTALKLIKQGLAGEIETRRALSWALDLTDTTYPGVDEWSLESLRQDIERREQELLNETRNYLPEAPKVFRLRPDARRQELQTPPLERLDLSMRYETMLERQLQRDVALLANVQRMRVLGPLGYRPMRALAAEEARGPSENGAEAAT